MAGDALRIYLFGEPRFEAGGVPHLFRAPPKTLPLLAYLLLHRQGAVTRERAAADLWPDADQPTAYSNLRRHLQYLAKALPQPSEDGTPSWLLATPKTIAWNLESPYWLDIEAFESQIQERTARSRAVRLYSGDLYERCTEEWIDFERERLRTLQLSTLAQLCADARERSAFIEALQYAQLVIAADPWREDAVRTMMEIRMLLGDRAGALADYERFARRLREELHTEPLAETTETYRRIREASQAVSRVAKASHAVTIVGRRNELAILREAWERAARGETQTVLVGGEAGIGKSTLVEALLETVAQSGGAILASACGAHDDNTYGAFAGIAQELGVDLLTPLANEDARLRVFEALAEALTSRARQKPLALVLEDLHWAGSAALELLRFTMLRVQRTPLLVVGTYREFELGRAHPLRALRRRMENTHLSHVALSALNRQDACALANACAGRVLEESLLERIYDRSDGNPLFIVELVRSLRETNREAVPASISEIVDGRLRRITEDARRLLETAAVAGSSCTPELLATVTGMREADVLAGIDELVAAHFLRQGTSADFCFVHDVIRQSVYERIDPGVARATHARVGFALQTVYAERFGEVSAATARHLECGGILDAAVEAYLIAAEHALGMYALEEAAAYANKLDGQPVDDARRFRALRVLENVAARRDDTQAQRRYAREMLEIGKRLDPERHGEALVRCIDASVSQPSADQRDELAALEALLAQVPQYVGAYSLCLGEYLNRLGDVRGSRESLERALSFFASSGDVEQLLRTITALYVVALGSGTRLEDLQERAVRMRESLGERADSRVCARLEYLHCGVLLDLDPSAAQRAAEEMLSHARDAGDLVLHALAHRCIGAAAVRRMRISEAQSHLRRSAEMTVISGRRGETAKTRSWQLMAENRCANFEVARAFGDQALGEARACDALDLVPGILGNLSNAAVWDGDSETAERLLRESITQGERAGYAQPSIQSLLGEVLVGTGRLAERYSAYRTGPRPHFSARRSSGHAPGALPPAPGTCLSCHGTRSRSARVRERHPAVLYRCCIILRASPGLSLGGGTVAADDGKSRRRGPLHARRTKAAFGSAFDDRIAGPDLAASVYGLHLQSAHRGGRRSCGPACRVVCAGNAEFACSNAIRHVPRRRWRTTRNVPVRTGNQRRSGSSCPRMLHTP